VTDVAPGASISTGEFIFASRLVEMLADSLPDGHYYFTATVRLSNRESIAGIPAGDFDLVLARPPMSVSRTADLMVYRASPVTVSGSPAAVHAQATATLEYAGGALVSQSRDCPLLIYAYRDRARRDTAPRSGPPDWAQPACGPTQQQVVMNSGDTRTLTSAVPVRDILGNPLRPGHYYFALVAQMQNNRVFLSAGEADLNQ